jgi:hypothetical protein
LLCVPGPGMNGMGWSCNTSSSYTDPMGMIAAATALIGGRAPEPAVEERGLRVVHEDVDALRLVTKLSLERNLLHDARAHKSVLFPAVLIQRPLHLPQVRRRLPLLLQLLHTANGRLP